MTLSHIATAHLKVPARDAFAFLADPVRLGKWSLGCMETRDLGNGLYAGHSLFDGGQTHFHVVARPETGLITWHVGDAVTRRPRILGRIIPGAECDRDPDSCLVSLIAWRGGTMDDARWQRLTTTHDTEILLIKAQCEAAHPQG